MKVHVQVTQEDIVRGCQDDGRECPVALALYRALNFPLARLLSKRVLYVRSRYLTFISKDVRDSVKITNLALDPNITDWIKLFDQDRDSVDPFTFEIDVPEEVTS